MQKNSIEHDMSREPVSRRTLLARSLAGASLMGLGTAAWPQGEWPRQPIKAIVPYAPGGVTDLTMRTISRHVAEQIGQPVVIDNRAGGAGAIGAAAVARSAPDGYTVAAVGSSTIIASPLLNANGPFDPSADFAFVSLLATVPMLLVVNASVPAANAADFLKYVQANKGKLNYGSVAVGHYGHVAMLEVSDSLQAGMVHSPYKGESALLQDLVGGQLQCSLLAPSTARPMVDAGRLRVLGVSGMKRLRSLPNVPTLAEQGLSAPVFKMNPGWVGVVAPARTPPAIVRQLGNEYASAVKKPAVLDQIAEYGMDPVGSTGEQFAATYHAERLVWKLLLVKAGLEVKG
ncbi:MAG: tripartite tricarboxylate transporter substrate binding protein [Comamonadaceae bacterium]|nr:MAG: tripartite tricarboxylate transporter substrate binding protein [Comamonadaceae bacterium]